MQHGGWAGQGVIDQGADVVGQAVGFGGAADQAAGALTSNDGKMTGCPCAGLGCLVRCVSRARPGWGFVMGGSTIVVGWGLGLALLVLTVLTVVGAAAGRLGVSVASVVAVGRAIVQLAVVSSVIVAVVGSWPATVAFVALMFGVASWAAGRRMTRDRSCPA